ncbi:TetR/AcrR family transcriptional regulator [Thermoactinospora rubra]|uniref:TetR/AcrR family transcriptional regulator n=1 Tax=Thermoactinospora rubra TaxID=1088767 RepID=UPI000A0FB202|nr:TetR/AcrR family transcriptional regulator [Thermoactinospora rubra]
MVQTAAERGKATRQRLFEAAVALIGEAGWSGVSTRMVAERAGVAPGVVHYHFASVTDLLVAASVSFARDLVDQLAAGLAEQRDLGGGLDWLLDRLGAYTGTDPASLLVAETYLASSRVPALRAELHAIMADFRRAVVSWLRSCGHAGDAEAAAVLLAAVVDGLVLHRALDPGLDLTALAGPLRAMLRAEPEDEA